MNTYKTVRRFQWLHVLCVLLLLAAPLVADAQMGRGGGIGGGRGGGGTGGGSGGGQRMYFDGGSGDAWIGGASADIAAFCIDQGIPPMSTNDQFLAVSRSVTVTRMDGGGEQTAVLNDVLGKPGWLRITGTGHANAIRVIPLTEPGSNVRFAIHFPTDAPAYLAGGIHEALRWDGSAAGALKGVADAERTYGRHAGTLQSVAAYSASLKALPKAGAAVALFEGDTGVAPRPRINWRLKGATVAAAKTAVRETLADFRLEVLGSKEIDRQVAEQVFRLPMEGETSATVSEAQLDSFVNTYRGYPSTVLATQFRRLTSKAFVQSGDLAAAVASAKEQVATDPFCRSYAQAFAGLTGFPMLAAAVEAKAREALEFSGSMEKAIRAAGLVGGTARFSDVSPSAALDARAAEAYLKSGNLANALN